VSYMGKTVVVRISQKIHDNALKLKNEQGINYMDKKSWFSFLVEKGMQKIRDEKT